MTHNTNKEEWRKKVIDEFDRIFIHENYWKSSDETEAFAPIENVRQFIWEKLEEVRATHHQKIVEELEKMQMQQTPYIRNRSMAPHSTDTLTKTFRKGFNEAIDQVLSIIKSKV